MKPRLVMTGCLLCALSISAPALDRSDIGFYLSFEKGLEPDISAGATTITATSGGTTSSLNHISLSPNPGQRTKPQTNGSSGLKASNGDARGRARSSGRAGGGVAGANGAACKQLNLPFDPEGVNGRAVSIENRTVSLSYKNAHMFSPKEGTIGIWVKTSDAVDKGGNAAFLDAFGARDGIKLYLYISTVRAYFGRAQDPLVSPWYSWKDGTWTHLAFTFRPGEHISSGSGLDIRH